MNTFELGTEDPPKNANTSLLVLESRLQPREAFHTVGYGESLSDSRPELNSILIIALQRAGRAVRRSQTWVSQDLSPDCLLLLLFLQEP